MALIKKYKTAIITGLIVAAVYLLIFLASDRMDRRLKESSPLIFGSTFMNMTNSYYPALNESLRSVIESNGDTLITRDPMESQDRQNKEIHDMIEEGMSVLFLCAVDWTKVEPALKECQEAGVAVFIIDTEVDDPDGIAVSMIESDQRKIGELIAGDLKKRMPGGGKLIVLYNYKVRSTIARAYGFFDSIAGDSRFEILVSQDNCSDLETSNREMNDLIQKYPEVDAVIAANDPAALGAAASIDMYRSQHVGEDDRKNILIYGTDGSPDAKEMISMGKMTGTVAQYPIKMGKQAAEAAYSWLNGEDVDDYIPVGVNLLTYNDINSENIMGWQ